MTPHLPKSWPDQNAYDRLYDVIDPYGHYAERIGPSLVRRIPPSLSAKQVYQRLPSAADHEFAGYLTRTRIVYWRGQAITARFPTSKNCTFHSHPTDLGIGDPDLPSLADIRQFLLGRHRRTITVGRSKLWVWDKTPLTLKVAKRLSDWERDHLLSVFSALTSKGIADVESETVRRCLEQAGFRASRTTRGWANWPELLTEKFGFKVTVMPRHER